MIPTDTVLIDGSSWRRIRARQWGRELRGYRLQLYRKGSPGLLMGYYWSIGAGPRRGPYGELRSAARAAERAARALPDLR